MSKREEKPARLCHNCLSSCSIHSSGKIAGRGRSSLEDVETLDQESDIYTSFNYNNLTVCVLQELLCGSAQATSPLSQSHLMENRSSYHNSGVKHNTDSCANEHNGRAEGRLWVCSSGWADTKAVRAHIWILEPEGQRQAQVIFRQQLTLKQAGAA